MVLVFTFVCCQQKSLLLVGLLFLLLYKSFTCVGFTYFLHCFPGHIFFSIFSAYFCVIRNISRDTRYSTHSMTVYSFGFHACRTTRRLLHWSNYCNTSGTTQWMWSIEAEGEFTMQLIIFDICNIYRVCVERSCTVHADDIAFVYVYIYFLWIA